MKVALVGLMQSGKSTLLASVSGKAIPPAGATTIEEAMVPVPDQRLIVLTELYQPRKTTYATIDCLDVPGFNFSDDSGRAAARRLINKIRTVDMLVLVVKGFGADADAASDLSVLQTELLLADLELVTTRIEKLEKQVHKPTKTQAHDKAELALQQKLQAAIEAEKPISAALTSDAERDMVKSLGFLTQKPMFVVVNCGEDRLDADFEFSDVLDASIPVISICAELEYELSQLDSESRTEFMADLGLTEPAAGRFVRSCYATVGLISFLTVGPDEVRAWPIRKGTIAHDAAGKIHSDIRRGFIRAETFRFDDLEAYGSEKELKAAGKIRLEGKEYEVQDGDVINFRFNV